MRAITLAAIAGIYVSAFAASAAAKVWLLPDYQERSLLASRINSYESIPEGMRPDNDTGADKGIKCSDYSGLRDPADLEDGMVCTSYSQIRDKSCCSAWACAPSYDKTSSICRSEGKIPYGASCEGKYEDCVCNEEIYPHTSSSCTPPLSDSPCVDRFGSHYPAVCENPCEGLTDNSTDAGCMKYYDQCPDLCEIGKQCVSEDCSGYPLAVCPDDAVCSSCKPGCGDVTTTYRVASCGANFAPNATRSKCIRIACETGSVDLNNYWCNAALRCWVQK